MTTSDLTASPFVTNRLDMRYFAECTTSAVVEETDELGKATVEFTFTGPGLRFSQPDASGKFNWLSSKENCDGVFLIFDGRAMILHLVELKRKITQSSWEKASGQFRADYLRARALLAVLGHSPDCDVVAHISFRTDDLSPRLTPTPFLHKTQVGEAPSEEPLASVTEWVSGEIDLHGKNARVNKIQQDADGVASHPL